MPVELRAHLAGAFADPRGLGAEAGVADHLLHIPQAVGPVTEAAAGEGAELLVAAGAGPAGFEQALKILGAAAGPFLLISAAAAQSAAGAGLALLPIAPVARLLRALRPGLLLTILRGVGLLLFALLRLTTFAALAALAPLLRRCLLLRLAAALLTALLLSALLLPPLLLTVLFGLAIRLGGFGWLRTLLTGLLAAVLLLLAGLGAAARLPAVALLVGALAVS